MHMQMLRRQIETEDELHFSFVAFTDELLFFSVVAGEVLSA